MSVLYYYEKEGQQAGPLASNQLVTQGVTASTLVWYEGIPEWVAAGTVPALRYLFAPPQPVPARPAVPASAHEAKPTRPRMPPPAPTNSVFTGKNILIGLVVLLALGAEVASRAKPDAAEPESTEQQDDAPAQEEEIGYAANHLHDEDASEEREEAEPEEPADSESAMYYWYGCTSCGKLLTAREEPGFSRCPAKTGISGVEHSWEKLGAVGDKHYTCYFCAASVSTDARPEPGKCLMSPNKGGISGLGHQWEESGVTINRM